MASSLSKIKSQIEKLQKQAASIQSTVIARMRREIAQHGLTASDLFGTQGDGHETGNGRVAPKAKAKTSKSSANKPAKFADDQGNTWHGIGKRPQWIHSALEAGRTLEEFLVGAAEAVLPTKSATKPVASRKKATAKKGAPKKAVAAEAAPAKKASATKKSSPRVAKPKKAGSVTPSKKVAAKSKAKTAPSKKAVATKKATRAAMAPVVAPAEAPAAVS